MRRGDCLARAGGPAGPSGPLLGEWRRAAVGALVVGAIACATVAGLRSPAVAHALPVNGNGNYTQILCADPSSEEGLGIPEMPEGLTNPASTDLWQVTSAETNCASGRMTPTHGIPMTDGKEAAYGQGTWSALLYQAPADITINGGTIYRAERAEGADNGFMGIIQQGGEYGTLYSLPRNVSDQGDWFAGNIASRGTFSWPFSPENLVNLTISPDGGHWDVNATCDPNGNNNSSCTLSAGQWEYRIYGGAISLYANNDPQASNISGPLSSESALRGSATVTFSATDEGPGLAYVKLIVDGNVVQSQTIDTNDGRCVPVTGTDAYTWAYQVPCKTSVGGRTYELNTTSVADGSHHVQVIIEDAAGNRSIVIDRTVETNNAPANDVAPSISAAGGVFGGSGLAANPGTWSAPSGAGSITYSYQWEDCDPQGNNCTAIAGADASSYAPSAADAGHTLRVMVDAADTDGSVSLTSAPTSAALTPPGSLAQSPPADAGGAAGSPPTGAGTRNGASASEDAQLRLEDPATISRSFTDRALKLSGRLLDGNGQPIGGATLDLLEQITPGGARQFLGHAQTSANGDFTAAVGPGPSRTIIVGYRAFSEDPGYTATAEVSENVAAGVQLEVNPSAISSTGMITLSGSVKGPMPRQGALVELLVHYRGRWEPFRAPRTNAAGRFRATYQFEGAVGRFPFRAEVPAGQAGYPYASGYSRSVTVNAD